VGLVHFDKARQELAIANTIDEVKEIRDRALAYRAYVKQIGESLEMQNMIAEIKIRAERKVGELLKEQGRGQGERDKKIETSDNVGLKPKLEEIGISYHQSADWQKIADIPEETFERHIVKTKEANEELTTASMLRLSEKQIRQERDEKEKQLKAELEEIPLPKKLYDVIVIDPPWGLKKIIREVRPNQKEFDYPTMTIEEIKAFPVKDVMTDNCHVFLWTTQKYLPYAFDILKEWGLTYVLTMVWHKNGGFQPFGLPQYNCEFVLYAHKGNPKFIDTKAFNCCFNGERGKHSEKPDSFYDVIDRVCDGNKIDIFARKERNKKWEVYGNEVI
jgi:N6-adenosine-specific RNA methylase IME4